MNLNPTQFKLFRAFPSRQQQVRSSCCLCPFHALFLPGLPQKCSRYYRFFCCCCRWFCWRWRGRERLMVCRRGEGEKSRGSFSFLAFHVVVVGVVGWGQWLLWQEVGGFWVNTVEAEIMMFWAMEWGVCFVFWSNGNKSLKRFIWKVRLLPISAKIKLRNLNWKKYV